MVDRGFCVMHLRMARHPLDPELVRTPTPEEWRAAERFAAEQAETWWDHNPVFAVRSAAEEYAWLVPVETEIAEVKIAATPMNEEDGWFDSFKAPYWFRVCEEI